VTTASVAAAHAQAPAALSWQRFHELGRALAASAAADGVPDVIVGVVRGGMMPAVLIAHQLGVRTVRAFDATHTVDDSVNAPKLSVPAVRDVDSLGDLTGLDVLIVDDVAGSGMTARVCVEHVGEAGAARVRSAVLVVNEANWSGSTPPGRALSYIGQTTDRWVVFPWEGQS
jgi:hypoxanthine phosphoribosyltransferase